MSTEAIDEIQKQELNLIDSIQFKISGMTMFGLHMLFTVLCKEVGKHHIKEWLSEK